LYSSPNIVRLIKSSRMRWAEHVVCTGGMINSYKVFVGKSEGKSPLGRHKRRWEDNTRKDVREIGW